ncbi:MAG: ribonuclease III [Bifidobacteriaceae bacterium]|nr:ribonuclease III [Bifidobacteriaceae bacterium]
MSSKANQNAAAGAANRNSALGAAEPLLAKLGIDLDPEFLVLALTHRSFAHEAGGVPNNERLEFLGDSVVGIIVTEYLYRVHGQSSEGDLAKMRSATVSQRNLAKVAREIGLGPCILLGRGELGTGGYDKDSILCDTFEALIGAVYLCHGMVRTRALVKRLLRPSLLRAADLGAGLDWKTSLQELAAERGLPVPEYQAEGTGPDHARQFTAWAIIGEQSMGSGHGSSKKIAEQAAAADAYQQLAAQSPTIEV